MAYVFLDRVVECEPGARIVALKALAYNEEFFRDHFPGMPVVPGAMVLEGFVQAARRCLAEAGDDGPWVLDSVQGLSFNRFATPGEVVALELERQADKETADEIRQFKALARVGDERVCRSRFAVRRAGI